MSRFAATIAKRYEGFGNGSSQRAQWAGAERPVDPANQPSGTPAAEATRFPLARRRGNCAASAQRVTEYVAITSGRSANHVMRRKPSASHCVTRPLLVAYKPSSLVF